MAGSKLRIAQGGPPLRIEEFQSMLALGLGLLITAVFGLAGWLAYRRRSVVSAAHVPQMNLPANRDLGGRDNSPTPAIDSQCLAQVNELLAARLWKFGYGPPTRVKSTERIDALVRDNVIAMLQVDTLANQYFPRRPTLMSELMRALDDPRVAAATLSRMIAHDPVLTGEVLRLANSSLYRIAPTPIETLQRAIAVCGVDALRAMLAAAMLRPVFRANSKNFPRLPRVLWNRTERAARAAELYAMQSFPQDRFESQMAVLLNALGPLVVYSAVVDVYTRNQLFPPNAVLCEALTGEMSQQVATRIAVDWQMSPRLVSALKGSSEEALTTALLVGELIGTLVSLESQAVISNEERTEFIHRAGLTAHLVSPIWEVIARPD